MDKSLSNISVSHSKEDYYVIRETNGEVRKYKYKTVTWPLMMACRKLRAICRLCLSL